MTTILIVDDDDRLRERLGQALVERGYHTLTAANHADALLLARQQLIDRAIVDLRMPGPHGLVVVQDLIALHADIEIVVVTGYGSIATAVEAIRRGARNYLTKPVHADQILAAFDADPDEASGAIEFEIPSLAKLEREHIERVLHECGGNVSKAARVLGMHRRTLQYKLAKFPVTR
ncbi:MAG: response regulator [Deltaproteobacteria bacterium]|nr:response regulator [Deltaproteobacteria bacterium]